MLNVSDIFVCLLILTEDFALDENDLGGTIAPEICKLRDKKLEKFIVDCPTEKGAGVGNYTKGGIDELLEIDANCFTICRRGA